jgi:hypothetical protein
MSLKVKRAASGRRKRIGRTRSERNQNPPSRYRWLTMLSDEPEASDNQEDGEENEELDEELSGGASQPLRIRRK